MEAIIQIAAGSRNECWAYDGLPLMEPVHIAIVADAPSAVPNAVQIFDLVHRRIAALAHQNNPCGNAQLLHCRGRSQPACLSLLVLVTGNSLISSRHAALVSGWVARAKSPLLVVLPPGANVGSVLPAHLQRWNAMFLDGGVSNIASAIEVAAGMIERRLFLSYRRSDTQALADQLFTAFERRGYRVFLDRFVGTPGRQFPQQIIEELVDKGAVLVLESPDLRASSWTLAEVAVAHLFSLGLFSIQVPGGVSLRGIPHRERLQPSEYIGATATPAAIDRIVDFVSRHYFEQSLRRRLTMKYRLQLTLAGEGLNAHEEANGTYAIPSGVTEYQLHLCARPPGINDMRRIIDAGGNRRKVIVAPHRLQPPDRVADTEWLAGSVGPVHLRNEWRMREMAKAINGGTL